MAQDVEPEARPKDIEPQARQIDVADPERRKKVLGLLVLVSLLAVFGVLRLDAYLVELRELAATDPAAAAAETLAVSRLFLAAIAGGAAVLAVYLGRLSWRTLANRRYPPPGMRVISDTRVVRGRRARRYGWGLLALAVVICAAGLFVSYRADRHLLALLRPGLEATDVSPAELRPEWVLPF